jgi:diaminopimelate epimerase
MKTINYYIANPSGNITAIVTDCNKDYNLINKQIMKKNPKVEQVGFIIKEDSSKKMIKFLMAGGEFCGNAIRCVKLIFCTKNKLKNCIIIVNNITINFALINSDAKITIKKSDIYSSTKIINQNTKYVTLKGISYIIIDEQSLLYCVNLTKLIASKILKNTKIKNTNPAIGVIFISKKNV